MATWITVISFFVLTGTLCLGVIAQNSMTKEDVDFRLHLLEAIPGLLPFSGDIELAGIAAGEAGVLCLFFC